MIDAEHPWPWLEAFPEYSAAFFNGRDDEAQALLRRILDEPVTVLFGKSGLGKTSLLQAGLFPLLRRERLLPVYVRLVHVNQAPGAGQQIMKHWQEEVVGSKEPNLCFKPANGCPSDSGSPEAESQSHSGGLWTELHRIDINLNDSSGQPWEPVFVLDQFEEIFTLGAGNPEKQNQTFFELGDLLENRMPAELAENLRGDENLRRRLKPEAQRYRFLLALREDYLPDLEVWACLIPSLKANRYRLLPMSTVNAINAIDKTGGALLDRGDAKKIVAYLSKSMAAKEVTTQNRRMKEWVEPMMLSLICSGLNQDRLDKKEARLPTGDLDKLGGLIVERFYESAFEGQPENLRQFVEQRLITPDGIRLKCPLETAENLTSHEQVAALERKRLIRRESFDEGDFIELIHDRLVVVVRKARDQRQAEEQRRQAEATAGDLRRRIGWLIILVGIFFLVMLWGNWQAYKTNKSNRQSKSLQLAFRAQGILDGSQSGSDALAYLQILAAKKLMPNSGALEEINTVLFSAIRTARSLYRIVETEAPITAVAIDKAGKRIATGHADGSLRLWNAETGEATSPLLRGGGPITSLAFSPDGSKLASGGNDRTLRLWEAGSGRLMAEQATGHEKAVTGVAFSMDGKKIVTSSADKTLRLWNADTLQANGGPLTGQDSGVTSVAFSPDGARLVSGSNGKALQLWDAATGKMLGKPMQGHTASVTSVAFSPDGMRIASGGEDQTVRLWDTKSGQPVGVLAGHEDVVTSVAFNPEGTQIVSGSQDQSVRLWDATNAQPIRAPLRGHAGQVSGVAFGLNGRLVSGGYDKTLRLWDADIGQLAGTGHNGTVASVAYSPDGRRIVTGSYDKTLRLWDATTGQPLGEPLRGHKAGVSSVAFSPDGSLIASGSYDKTLILWEAAKRQAVGEPLMGHSAGVSSVAFSPKDGKIVSGGDDGTVRLWALKPRPSMLLTILGHSDIVTSVAFSPDGTKIASGGNDRTVQVWNAADGKLINTLAGHEDAVTSVAFSPDGKTIASGSRDLTVRLWDVKAGRPLLDPLRSHADWVSSVAYSPDGHMVASGSRDRTLRLWDAHTGKPIGPPFSGHRKGVWSVAFSPDGKWVASGSADRTLQLWCTSIDVSADELCKKLGRNMTQEEWNDKVSKEFNYIVQCPNLPIP